MSINERPLVAPMHFGARRVKSYFLDVQMRREGGAKDGLLLPPGYLLINDRPLVAIMHFGGELCAHGAVRMRVFCDVCVCVCEE